MSLAQSRYLCLPSHREEVHAKAPAGRQRGDQRWATFLRNHAKAITGLVHKVLS